MTVGSAPPIGNEDQVERLVEHDAARHDERTAPSRKKSGVESGERVHRRDRACLARCGSTSSRLLGQRRCQAAPSDARRASCSTWKVAATKRPLRSTICWLGAGLGQQLLAARRLTVRQRLPRVGGLERDLGQRPPSCVKRHSSSRERRKAKLREAVDGAGPQSCASRRRLSPTCFSAALNCDRYRSFLPSRRSWCFGHAQSQSALRLH